jgi:U3 small nucleolar RNA-associated protein 3
MYMLLKAEYASNNDKNVDPSLIQNHPVLLHLQKTNALMQRLEENVENKVDGLKEQLDNLAKAALLMNQPQESSDHDGEDSSESDEESESEEILQDQDQSMEPVHESGASTSESESDDSDNELKVRRKVLTEARFGLRPNEIVTDANIPRKRRRAIDSDAGDHDIRDETQQKAVSRALATTLNSIEQRAESRKRKSARDDVERIDEIDDDRELRRGLAMMESELGKGSDEEEDDQSKEAGGDFGDDLDKDNDFYDQIQKKSKAKKEFRTELYRVAPKFPRVEEEIVGERAISKQILKNRGLVAHKAKINRNPRVKKREQYRKALIRRKGAVREVRTDEGHKYGGEETGIKTSLSRSRKLAR